MKGLYIHIPFCARKCKYCDFVSAPPCADEADRYITSLLSEAEAYRGEGVDTVFIGGGTPSLLSVPQIEKLVRGINSIFNISSDAEFTTEANPDSITDEKLRAFTSHGVNRVSLGVQSFSDKELSVLGRLHTADAAKRAAHLALSNTDNVNIDLMTGIPCQTMDSLAASLNTAAGLGATHISCYSLIIEEGTPFYEAYNEGTLLIPDEDEDRRMYLETGRILAGSGFGRYEISNYAKDGFSCRHNLKYWELCDYIGIGVSAHSYIGRKRFANTSKLSDYLNGTRTVSEETIDERGTMAEFMILGLRKTDGIKKSEFKRRFLKSIDEVYGEVLEKHLKLGLLEQACDSVRLTGRGVDVSNSVLCDFI